ncbi:MAG: enoyl-CoA hydratase/isomerase family protein [Acidimicrobiia bacterium]
MSALTLAHDGPLAWITIDRPDRKHAWSAPMWAEMSRLMSECASDESVRVVLIDSSGDRVFSAGADLDQFVGSDETGLRAALDGVEGVMRAIETCPKPVLAVVSGAAVGAGLEIAAACDVRIASSDAWFSIPAAQLGVVITRTDINRLVRALGKSMAADLLLTGRRLTAQEAAGLGFVRSVHPAGELREAAGRLGREMAGLDSKALAAMKRHLTGIGAISWDEQAWRPSLGALVSEETQERLRKRGPGASR